MAWVVMALLTFSPELLRGSSGPDPSPRLGGKEDVADELDLRPNPGPEPLPPATTWRGYASLAMMVGAIGLSGWLLVIWLRRPRPVRIPPADAWALAELDRLDKHPPVSDDDVRRYCTQVSSILRQFLDRRFGFRAVEQTTPEFTATLQAANTLSPEQKAGLIDLLKQTDLVKFAAVVPDAPERAGLVSRVRDFIRAASTVTTPPPPGS